MQAKLTGESASVSSIHYLRGTSANDILNLNAIHFAGSCIMAFRNKVRVKLQDTDAAGILFFASQLIYAHETFEKFMEQIGFDVPRILKDESYILPIVHADADYSRPLGVGDRLEIELIVAEIGNTSFTLNYFVRKEDGSDVGSCRTVHVTIDKNNRKKIPLPTELRQALEKHGSKQD